MPAGLVTLRIGSPWLRKRTPVWIVGRKPLDQLAAPPLMPLPVELGGPAWVVFLARWFEWVLGATVAEWAAGRLTLPRVLRTPWPGIATLGVGVWIEWHTGSYGLYVVKEPVYGVAFALLLYAALSVVLFLAPLNLIQVQHYTATAAGTRLSSGGGKLESP